jgi:NADPH:quinone reductase-like Zn-dependent oxidoreductase
MAAQGLYPDAPKLPAVLGYEAAGVIDKVGEGVDERRAGSHVTALARYGAHSDVVCVPAAQAFAIPPGKDFTEAAAIPVNYVTAYHILFRAATIRPGERVLVHMAAGGLGTAALQLCRTVDGVETFGTASAAKHAALREEGCTHPIDYHTTDYAREIRRLTGGEGVDEVLALWAAGTITPRIDATYPFTQAAEAHRRILSHGNTGKIILTPAG